MTDEAENADEDMLRQAVDRAWTVYRGKHNFMSRMNAGACLSDTEAEWRAGEHDAEES
jgi:hypothetical protein